MGALAAIVFLATLGLACTAVAQKSVTVDEFQALPHGLAMLRNGDYHLDCGVPPLTKELAALPLLLTSARLDPAEAGGALSSWEIGGRFMKDNAADYQALFGYGRAVSLAFLLATCMLTYGLARSLYGPGGGLLAAVVAGFSPNLLAHGPLVTPDIYLAAGVIGSLWAFDRLLLRPGWGNALALGGTLGLACLSKFTGLLLVVLYPTVLMAFQAADAFRPPAESAARIRWRRVWLATALALVVVLIAINACYGLHGCLTPLGHYEFETRLFQSLQRLAPGVPVPLPYFFVRGMDAQLAEQGYPAYLLGRFSPDGFFHYYLVGLLVKTPTPVLFLAALAFFGDRRLRRREVPLVVVAAAALLFFSLNRHKNIGMRYLLFLEPIWAVWIGRLALRPAWALPWGRSPLAWVTVLGCVALVASSARMWPDYLAYFNLVSGGPSRGHKYLLDSNLDWGQDLITLRKYMEREGIGAVDLAYFGRVDPSVYGITYTTLGLAEIPQDGRPLPGGYGTNLTPWGVAPLKRYAAVSANLLWGRMYVVNGTAFWPPDPDTYQVFRGLKPKAVLGYTIYVYDLAHPEWLPPR